MKDLSKDEQALDELVRQVQRDVLPKLVGTAFMVTVQDGRVHLDQYSFMIAERRLKKLKPVFITINFELPKYVIELADTVIRLDGDHPWSSQIAKALEAIMAKLSMTGTATGEEGR